MRISKAEGCYSNMLRKGGSLRATQGSRGLEEAGYVAG